MQRYISGDRIFVFMEDSEVKEIVAEKTGCKKEWINCSGAQIEIPMEKIDNERKKEAE